jgi:alkylhydroperoxidase family enzyme
MKSMLELRLPFSEQELSDLTLAVATINAWNRLAFLAGPFPENIPGPSRTL